MAEKHEKALSAAHAEALRIPRTASASRADVKDIITAYLAARREPAEDEMRVKMCVAVAPDGEYDVAGRYDADDEELRCNPDFPEDAQYRWVNAVVKRWRKPDEPVVEGEVANDGK